MRRAAMPASTDAPSARGRSWAPFQWQASSARTVGCGNVAEQRPGRASSAAASARVQRGALARQQVLVDRLADERVAERVRAVGMRDEDLVGDGLARAGEQVVGRQ